MVVSSGEPSCLVLTSSIAWASYPEDSQIIDILVDIAVDNDTTGMGKGTGTETETETGAGIGTGMGAGAGPGTGTVFWRLPFSPRPV